VPEPPAGEHCPKQVWETFSKIVPPPEGEVCERWWDVVPVEHLSI